MQRLRAAQNVGINISICCCCFCSFCCSCCCCYRHDSSEQISIQTNFAEEIAAIAIIALQLQQHSIESAMAFCFTEFLCWSSHIALERDIYIHTDAYGWNKSPNIRFCLYLLVGREQQFLQKTSLQPKRKRSWSVTLLVLSTYKLYLSRSSCYNNDNAGMMALIPATYNCRQLQVLHRRLTIRTYIGIWTVRLYQSYCNTQLASLYHDKNFIDRNL